MRTHKLFLFSVFILWQSAFVFAQSEKYLHISPGIQSAAERDYGYSPLHYSGFEYLFSMSFSRINDRRANLISVSMTTGGLQNSFGKTMQIYTGNIQTYRFYVLQDERRGGIQHGWSNFNEFSIRNSEVADNFNFRSDYFTSFGPAVKYYLPFSLLNQALKFETLLHFQLIGFKIHSAYVSSGIEGFDGEHNSSWQAFIRSLRLFYPGDSWSMGVWPALNYRFGSGNKLSLNYRYDYIRLKGPHTTEKSRGKYFISLMFAL